MKSSAQVVVIGGGVVGASVLYHLTELGWTDVVLVERKELTAGSTWHAAGGMHTLNGDPSVAKLQQYTVNLYREIEKRSGQDCGIHMPGGLMLADDRERMDWLRMAQARGRYLGMDMEIISAAEARRMFPLLAEQHFIGALFDPAEGHVDPAGVTRAYAVCARQAGAEIYQHTWVSDLRQRPDGTWDVITGSGEIHAEHIVNAGGLWAREVGRMIGLELPVLAMEHMYLITEDMPEVAEYNAATGRELRDTARHVRAGVRALVAARGAVDLRQAAADARSRPDRPVAGDSVPALSGAGGRGDQDRDQRAVHLRPGRQPAGRPGAWRAQLLGGLRGDGGVFAGRRRGPHPRALDGRRRSW
jgi:glycine/D-amino acid oxidase-like deaminating enzyme